ncbi:MAG: NERD domain-containing protein [Bryobacterales bacterium]|nr:NERD domain-containing protein [Bryobacterales bacterium]
MTSLYIGSPIAHESERVVLEQILNRLAPLGRPAVVLANVVLGVRQIDFIVGSNDLALVIEAKGFNRPVRGGKNGLWQVQVSSGNWKDFQSPSNPYVQARDAALEVKDAMRSFCGGEVPYPAAAVIFAPRIPAGSKICTGDFKVSVSGLDGLDKALRPRQTGAWLCERWTSFASYLELTPVDSVAAACDERLAEAEALLRQYSAQYTRAYAHPDRVVPFSCRSGGEAVTSDDIVGLVAEQCGDVLIQGPSGCGKTLLANQAGRAFSQHGGIALTIPAQHYSGSIKAVLNREIKLLCDASAITMLGAVRKLNRPLVLIVDGYNECNALDRPSLARAVAALARTYEANVLVTSQCPPARRDLLPLHTVEVPPATPETKTAIALNVTGGEALPIELVHLLDAVSTGLEARLIGEAGRQLSAGGSRYALFDGFTRKRLEDIASDGIRLLSNVAGWLSKRFAFSLSVRDLDRLMDLDGEAHATATRLRSAGLLIQRGDRISFAHEMFFQAFAAENVVRRASGSAAEVLTALDCPVNADRKAFIIGAIDDDVLLDQVLDGLTDDESIAACIAGTCGRAAREWAEARCRALWDRLRTEVLAVSVRISDQGWMNVAFEESTLTTWTASDCALLTVMPQRIVEGHYLDEALETAGILDRRIFEEAVRLRGEARARKVALRSALFANAYVFRWGAVPGLTRICSLLQGGLFRTTHDAVTRTIQRKLEANGLSFGQVYLLLMLSRGADIAASLITRALETHWAPAPYHLRLALLDAARLCRSENDRDRSALIAAVEALPQPQHILISSTIIEVLGDLGALQESEREHITVVRNQISQCLTDPEDADLCAMAYGLHSAQFDHPYSGAYDEVLAGLPKSERKTLLAMATKGAGDAALFLGPLLIDLASFDDSSVGDTIAQWTALPPPDSVMPQYGISVFVVAHIALARLGCPLPSRRAEANGHSAEALLACGTILYWCNRIQIEETARRRACDASLRVLVRHEHGAALDVIRHCEQAFLEGLERLPGRAPLERSIVNGFPVEAAEICRNALAGSVSQVGYFPHHSEYVQKRNLTFAIQVMALHGGSTDLRLLKDYADDAALGTTAIAAVRVIEGRLAAG